MFLKKSFNKISVQYKRNIKKNVIISEKELNVQIFQINPPLMNINMIDIEDCIESSENKLSYQQKKDIFYSHGIDYDKVFQYYEYIQKINYINYNKFYTLNLLVSVFNFLKA